MLGEFIIEIEARNIRSGKTQGRWYLKKNKAEKKIQGGTLHYFPEYIRTERAQNIFLSNT